MDTTEIDNLHDLCDLMNSYTSEEINDMANDLASLPTFGGPDILDTDRIFSWDATDMITWAPDTSDDAFVVVPRTDLRG